MLRQGLKTAYYHSLMHIDLYLKDADPWQSHNSVWCRFVCTICVVEQFVRIRTTLVKTWQIGRCQELDKFGRHFVNVCNLHFPIMFILFDCVLMNDSFFSERDLAMPKMINFLLLFSQLSIG